MLPLFLLLVAAGVTAAVGQEEAQGSSAKEPAAASDQQSSQTGASSTESTTKADDGEVQWLVDKSGRKYRVEPYPKDWPHQRLEGDRLRTVWGITVEIDHEDGDTFYYKVYDTPSKLSAGPSARVKRPTDEEKQEIRKAYSYSTPKTDRVRLVPFDEGLPKAGQWRQGLVVADMDGDGHLDIVHGPVRKSSRHPQVFLGDGKGDWTAWKARYPQINMDYGDVAVADFDGDHTLDLALAMHLTGTRVLVREPPADDASADDQIPTFKDWSEGLDYRHPGDPAPPKYTSRAVVAVDWNQDGRMDVLTLGEGPRLEVSAGNKSGKYAAGGYGPVVYLNQGDGTWVRRDQGTDSSHGFGDDLVVGDLNGDGRPDFVTASSTMGNQALLYYGQPDGSWTVGALQLLRPQAYVRAVDLADFDRNGLLDIVIGFMAPERDGQWRSGVDVFLQKEKGSWQREHVYSTEDRRDVRGIAAGDVDGDGVTDIVATTGWRNVWVFLGDEQGGFDLLEEAKPPLEQIYGCRGYDVQLADLDGDGRDEIVAAFAGERQGMPGVISLPGCPAGGSLRAWDVLPNQ